MRLLAIGDIIGRSGRACARENILLLKKEYDIDMIIANGENSAGGLGITKNVQEELYDMGIDVITLGNHTWSKRDVFNFLDDNNRIVRPANFPSYLPGFGSVIYDIGFKKVGVINIIGRVFMDPVDSPFTAVKKEINNIKKECDFIIVDFHAETTSEKVAMGWYLDGEVSVVFGTHTHVATADERILPKGTGYITDLGMTGPIDSILGAKKECILKRLIDLVPERYEVALGESEFNGAIFEINDNTKKVENIIRIRR